MKWFLFAFAVFVVISCGTEPKILPGDVRLEIAGNQPDVYIEPPEEFAGNGNSVITERTESSGGLLRSYSERIEYNNITVYRKVTNITYYSYWHYGLLKSCDEERRFEPMGIEKDIEIDHCLYGYSRELVNYEALVNGIPYYYAGEFDPDSADYGQFPTAD